MTASEQKNVCFGCLVSFLLGLCLFLFTCLRTSTNVFRIEMVKIPFPVLLLSISIYAVTSLGALYCFSNSFPIMVCNTPSHFCSTYLVVTSNISNAATSCPLNVSAWVFLIRILTFLKLSSLFAGCFHCCFFASLTTLLCYTDLSHM